MPRALCSGPSCLSLRDPGSPCPLPKQPISYLLTCILYILNFPISWPCLLLPFDYTAPAHHPLISPITALNSLVSCSADHDYSRSLPAPRPKKATLSLAPTALLRAYYVSCYHLECCPAKRVRLLLGGNGKCTSGTGGPKTNKSHHCELRPPPHLDFASISLQLLGWGALAHRL